MKESFSQDTNRSAIYRRDLGKHGGSTVENLDGLFSGSMRADEAIICRNYSASHQQAASSTASPNVVETSLVWICPPVAANHRAIPSMVRFNMRLVRIDACPAAADGKGDHRKAGHD
jgi:hypothetical protein